MLALAQVPAGGQEKQSLREAKVCLKSDRMEELPGPGLGGGVEGDTALPGAAHLQALRDKGPRGLWESERLMGSMHREWGWEENQNMKAQDGQQADRSALSCNRKGHRGASGAQQEERDQRPLGKLCRD